MDVIIRKKWKDFYALDFISMHKNSNRRNQIVKEILGNILRNQKKLWIPPITYCLMTNQLDVDNTKPFKHKYISFLGAFLGWDYFPNSCLGLVD